MHAIKRMLVANRAMAVRAILIDAKNPGTTGFHKNFGFVPFLVAPCPVFLPTATARKAVSAAA